MKNNVLKSIIGGLLLGAFLFFLPFLLIKIIGFFLVFGLLMWLFKGRRSHWYAMVHPDKIRSMSEEEYNQFKSNFGHRQCGHRFSDYQDVSNQKNNENEKKK